MRKPITTFNGWLLGKINNYLKAREGCTVETTEYTDVGARTIIQDSLGFRYEVSVRMLGRAIAEGPMFDDINAKSKLSGLSILGDA